MNSRDIYTHVYSLEKTQADHHTFVKPHRKCLIGQYKILTTINPCDPTCGKHIGTHL